MHEGCSGRCRILLQAAKLWRGGMRTFEQGDNALGEAMQRQAIGIIRNMGGFSVLEAKIHNNIGVILSCGGRQAEARQEFSRALDLLAGRIGTETRFHQLIVRNFRQTLAARQPQALEAAQPTFG